MKLENMPVLDGVMPELELIYDEGGQRELLLDGVKLPSDFTVDRVEYPELGTNYCVAYLKIELSSYTASKK